MVRKPTFALVLVAVLVPITCGSVDGSPSDLDERIPVEPGGTAYLDVELGEGFSFDKGSLEVRSHDAGNVRILAETTGWGAYAVDLKLTRADNDVRLVGRVDGFLHWIFGGPTVEVRVWVPAGYGVDSRILGGPMLLEDLAGPVTARVDDDELTVRRVEGPVKLASARGSIDVEDIEGALEIASGRGSVDVHGVHGSVRIAIDRGSLELESVTGTVEAETQRGHLEIEDVRGDVSVSSDRGHVEVEDVEGSVVAKTDSGRIEIEELYGSVHAFSGRGGIEVEFAGKPSGSIETARGSIEIEVPRTASFQLEARTDRGRIELDDLGDAEDEAVEEQGRRRQISRAVNGGGPTLRLRTRRGEISVEGQ